jgi:hypothetical protein
MPALTTTQTITQKRDGRAFDKVSDAVDEGQYTSLAGQPSWSQVHKSDHVNSECSETEAVGRCLRI